MKPVNELERFENFEPLLDIAKEKNKALRRKRTPKDVVKTRKGKAGQFWKYIDRLDAMRWLDENYPIWSWEFDKMEFQGGQYYGKGTLTVLTSTGASRKIATIGSVEERIESSGNKTNLPYAKMVDTDALKRAVFSLGAFADVYKETNEEPAFPMPSNEDITWYWTVVYNVIKDKVEAQKIAEKFLAFIYGDIDRQYISKQLGNI
jgi:hypothetical protein